MAAVQRPTQPAQLNEPAMSPSTLLSSLLPHQIKQESQPAATTSTNVAPPTRDDDAALEFDDLPPFPSDVPTAPLLRISLSKLARGDEQEVDRLWKACYELGFFYLDLRDSRNGSGINGDQLLRDANSLFAVGEEIFALPVSEKVKYDFKDRGSYFGYKGYGSGVIDAQGTKDRNEFYNVSKDDILGISEALPAPSVLDPHRALLKSYMTHSHAIVTLLLRHLNTRLQLPSSTLESLHRLSAVSGDQVRWVHAPPQPMDDRKTALGEHTDFGSVTVLFNRLGGLQVLPPGADWCYVKPLRGHAVVNLGDAMVKFSAGILRSNIHRVVNPPGQQGECSRMSLVYFARPEDDIVLKVLEGSELIDDERKGKVEFKGEEEVTSKEWILRRALGRRDGGDWSKSGGTESRRTE